MNTGRKPTQSQSQEYGLLGALRTDLRVLHARWMGLAFSRYRQSTHPVMGTWRPTSTIRKIVFQVWSLLGWLGVIPVYPVVLVGFAIRFHVRRMDRFAKRVGAIGLVITSLLLWAALTAGAYFRDFSVAGLLAVIAAGGVATISGVLARLFSTWDGRPLSVLFAYPFAVTAVFLPPVVAALYSETVAAVVFSRSEVLAIWILDSILAVGGLNTLLRSTFDLVGLAYVGMWFALAIPVGWILGLLVALADMVRPATEDAGEATSP